jgi:hypothetical protein
VSCSDDDEQGGEDPPTTVDDIFEVTGTAITSLDVQGNDQELDNTPLTVTIEDQPSAGSASVNSDGTVNLSVPSGFRGATRFRYRLTNSLGGFSISSAVVFVEVPSYRVLFAAQNNSQNYELYISDLNDDEQISQATSGNFRLQNSWVSPAGSLVVYERADGTQASSNTELYLVKTNPIASPVRIPLPTGRAFVNGAPVFISSDERYVAFPTSNSSGQNASLYVYDSTTTNDPVAVGLSTNLSSGFTVWGGDTPSLYFLAAPGNTPGPAVYRADIGSLDSPQRISPFYNSTDTQTEILVSPDKSQVVVVGVHSGISGAFLLDPDNTNLERRLTSDMPNGATLESYDVDEGFTQITYLWRQAGSTNARLSTADIATSGTPATVLNADITSFTELRPDGAAALITRGPGGAGADGTLFEVTLDGSASDVRIAANVSGGLYDDTGDRVYLFSRTLTPSVIQRSDFDRQPDPLVRTSTPPAALFVTPEETPSVAILEDPTSGLVVVNASSPGDTIRISDRTVGNVPFTLLPTTLTAN